MKRYGPLQHIAGPGLGPAAVFAFACAWGVWAHAQPAGDEAGPLTIDDTGEGLVVPEAPAQAEGEPVELEAQSRTQPRGFGGQVRLTRELASANRLRGELDRLLSPDGRFNAANNGVSSNRLAGLAARCSVLVNNAEFDQTRYVLLGCQARIISALAQLDPADQGADPRPRRIEQIRGVADQIRKLSLSSAEPTADYWQLMVDLADAGRSNASIGSRQKLAERLLAGYIENYEDASVARGYVTDARLSLARLLDERGDQGGSSKQLDAIGGLDEDDPRRTELAYLRSRAERIGTRIELEGVTTRLEVWRSADHAGQPVLVHVYADAVTPSVKMIKQIQQTIAARALGGFTIVSLRVGEPGEDSPATPWPTLPVDLEDKALEQLGVDALPVLAWLDGEGRLASIGYTTAVMQQMPKPKPPAEPDEAGDGADPADPAEADPPEGPESPDEAAESGAEG